MLYELFEVINSEYIWIRVAKTALLKKWSHFPQPISHLYTKSCPTSISPISKNRKCRWSAACSPLWEGVRWGRWKCSQRGKGSGNTPMFCCSPSLRVCASVPHRWRWIWTRSNLRGLCASQCGWDWGRTCPSRGPKGFRRDRWSPMRFWPIRTVRLPFRGGFWGVRMVERRQFPFHQLWLFE